MKHVDALSRLYENVPETDPEFLNSEVSACGAGAAAPEPGAGPLDPSGAGSNRPGPSAPGSVLRAAEQRKSRGHCGAVPSQGSAGATGGGAPSGPTGSARVWSWLHPDPGCNELSVTNRRI